MMMLPGLLVMVLSICHVDCNNTAEELAVSQSVRSERSDAIISDTLTVPFLSFPVLWDCNNAAGTERCKVKVVIRELVVATFQVFTPSPWIAP
jgi:hypothetical protein